jgi:ubiquitin carboxyl-terminal hydrolase 4/11/15
MEYHRYLVDAKWLKKWKKYTGYNDWDHTSAGNENDNPGPIDNFNLFKNQTSEDLKDHLKEDDYSLLPKAAYDILVDWYGLSPGSRPIRRCVVEFGSTISKTLKVEIYIFDIKLCVHSNINETKSCPFSRADTVRKVQNKLIELFQVPEGTETRVWQVWPDFMKNRYDLLSNVDQTVSDVGIYGGQLIMLEIKDSHGQWPCEKMNVCKQAREQQQLKVQSGVVFESVIMRLGG